MSTMQDVLDLARFDLNDPKTIVTLSGTSTLSPRYPDSDLLKFANDGIALALTIRPDLYFGSWSTPYSDLALTDIFPLTIEYRPAITAYVVARNQSGDDAFVIQGRADKAMADYLKGLGGH